MQTLINMRTSFTLGTILLATLIVPAQDVLIDVGSPQTFGLCYADNMDTTVAYGCTGGVPLYLYICSGQLELCCDMITIYDGLSDTAPILFYGNNSGNVAELLAISTNPDNALTVRITTNGSVNCSTEGYIPLTWSLNGGEALPCNIGIAEVGSNAVEVSPNPTEGLVRLDLPASFAGSIQVDVMDMRGQVVFAQQRTAEDLRRGSLDLSDLAPGAYSARFTAKTTSLSAMIVIAR
jgi:Secretion system C-terminal sorting domain